MPVEVMANRGRDTLRFGPLKPVGLRDPRTGRDAHAIVQLRQEDRSGRMWNLVGFQTRLRIPEQQRVIRMIPGLENAEFLRYGSIHRNSYLNSPAALSAHLAALDDPALLFAGQITGCEGYVESAAVGLVAGIMAAGEIIGKPWHEPPRTTALGALMAHITGDAEAASYQPMNVNFGLFPPTADDVKKKQRKEAYTARAKADFPVWMSGVA